MNLTTKGKELKIILCMTLFIVCFMILISCIFIISPNNKANSFEISEDSIRYVKGEGVIVKGNNKVKLYNSKVDKVEELDLEEYIAGVVSAEMMANFDIEALKAQAVAARTFYFSKRLSSCQKAKGGEICDSTHCQVYLSKEESYKKWGSKDGNKNWQKILEAVNATSGEVLIYNDSIVKYPLFFATSWGKTEDSVEVFSNDVPYLKSTDSMGEEGANKYETLTEINIIDFINTANKSYPKAKLSKENISSKVSINSRTIGGAVKEVTLAEEKISGVDFRKLFNLNSANFSLEFGSSTIKINCKGYGHGVGMSQNGANVMGRNGKNYNEILKHYYTGVEIEKVKYE